MENKIQKLEPRPECEEIKLIHLLLMRFSNQLTEKIDLYIMERYSIIVEMEVC